MQECVQAGDDEGGRSRRHAVSTKHMNTARAKAVRAEAIQIATEIGRGIRRGLARK